MFPYDLKDSSSTIDVLKKIRVEEPDVPIKLVWDGVSYHRSQIVKEAVKILEIHLEPLPAYSPDFMPVEHLSYGYAKMSLIILVTNTRLNSLTTLNGLRAFLITFPLAIADRLWVKNYLDPEEEKLRFST